jgi:hypothetical protein
VLQTQRVPDDTLTTTFWERLQEASRDIGLPCSLSDIGRELDVWPSAVQKWQDGVGLPAQKNLITLAINRGVNTEWLKTGRGKKYAESAMDAATRELLTIWTKLPPEAQERLLGAARYEKTISPSPASESPPPAAATQPSGPFRPRVVPKDPAV